MKKWPKTFPPLTPEQKAVSDDFMNYWHEVLPNRYGVIEKFNHGYPVDTRPADFLRTLEIGAGRGEHLAYEVLTPEQRENYVALELRPQMAEAIAQRFPWAKVITGDCQERLPFPDGHFDRIVAVHVLEHLPDLPAAVREAHRLCDKNKGVFQVVIPCEGSLAYSLARKISAERIFVRRYKMSYRWFIEREHINLADEIVEELKPFFTVADRRFFPIPLPVQAFNLCLGMTLVPRRTV